MKQKELPDFSYEKKVWRKGFRFVAGADEVGRGAFAGPLVAAAVVFPSSRVMREISPRRLVEMTAVRIDDSKKLTAKQREKAAEWVKKNALAWGVGEVNVATINRLGIVKATQIAFRKAIKQCGNVDFLLVDAFYVPYTKGLRRKNQLAIIKGDEKSISIAAASIIAKVYRDNLMSSLARSDLARLGAYRWDKNKGYGTRDHREAIRKHGITRLHRKLFVKKAA
ncbi:MAG: ribonuclease HII [Candidatus Blackburnbacteria bacterium RIFCSPHIGHO2_01_FULL_43_15b]|uniref:Ribonuclease n=1 Tax=Candidatus Blackburnbacteria bacterium RIFCSPHIGHO2_01_FULL_43_15b TaxID=1797513 RepID=A0A1G1V085_9BACT|nr:MAG: ribonuclease HII [Candidatus Blackburnbacteria bacterium RIFCSPHIGHO2_01_FULL_43_15b]